MDRCASWLLAGMLAMVPAQAQVFKWVDEKGRVQYGEKPPDGVKATELKSPGPSPSVRPESPESWKEKDLEFQRRRVEREEQLRKEAAARDRSSVADRNECARARRLLEALETSVVYSRNQKGERVYLEDSERPAKVEEAKKRVEQSCPP